MTESTTPPSPPRRPLLAWRSGPFPLDWDEEFGRGGPLHLEIGFGDGRFTARRAGGAPDERFVGLEIASGSVQRALKRLKREGVDNVRLAKAGANFALRHLFAPRSLTSIVANFPDPWPKERHVKYRLLQRRFFELAASRLVPGGEIRLATDHPDYLAFARAEGEASGLFALDDRLEPPEAVFETKYALKWKSQGKPLFYQVFAYTGEEAPSFTILERPESMPHALLGGRLPERTAFSKRVSRYGAAHVILHEAASSFDERGDRWLVRATVDEPDLRQQILVVVQRRDADGLIVRLESFGDPVVTEGVRGAVDAVTGWLEELGLRVVERNY